MCQESSYMVFILILCIFANLLLCQHFQNAIYMERWVTGTVGCEVILRIILVLKRMYPHRQSLSGRIRSLKLR